MASRAHSWPDGRVIDLASAEHRSAANTPEQNALRSYLATVYEGFLVLSFLIFFSFINIYIYIYLIIINIDASEKTFKSQRFGCRFWTLLHFLLRILAN
jgi:hypothetical protein